MNKIYLLLLAVASLLVSCQTESDLDVSLADNTDDRVVVTASVAADTKVYFDNTSESGNITLSWQNTTSTADSFTLYDASGARVCDFIYTGVDGAQSGNFTSEDSVALNEGATYTAVVPASTAATLTAREDEYTITAQSITDIEALDHLNGAVRLSAEFEYSSETNISLTFSHEVSLIMLSVEMDTNVTPSQIEVSDAADGGVYTVTLPANTPSSFTTYIAVESVEVSEAREITFTITDTNGATYVETKSSAVSFEAGTYYSAALSFVTSGEEMYLYCFGSGQTASKSDDGTYAITNSEEQSNTWDTQFCIVFGESSGDDVLGIELGYTYSVSMMVKSDGESIELSPGLNNGGSYLTTLSGWIATTSEWQEFAFDFEATDAMVGGNRITFSIGKFISTLYVSDISILRVSDSPVSDTADTAGTSGYYTVGQLYPDDESPVGVVFEISNGGANGKVVSLVECQNRWGTESTYEYESDVIFADEDDGRTITQTLIEKRKDASNFSTDYYVFNWLYTTMNDSDINGVWYMPAKHELMSLLAAMSGYTYDDIASTWDDNSYMPNYNNESTEVAAFRSTIVNAGGTDFNMWGRYWSATEINTGYSWAIRFETALLDGTSVPKSDSWARLRPIMQF